MNALKRGDTVTVTAKRFTDTGLVMQAGTSFVRVWFPNDPLSHRTMAEWFPIQSRGCAIVKNECANIDLASFLAVIRQPEFAI